MTGLPFAVVVLLIHSLMVGLHEEVSTTES